MRHRDFLNTSTSRSHCDADISPISFDRYQRSRVTMLDHRLLVVLQRCVYRLPLRFEKKESVASIALAVECGLSRDEKWVKRNSKNELLFWLILIGRWYYSRGSYEQENKMGILLLIWSMNLGEREREWKMRISVIDDLLTKESPADPISRSIFYAATVGTRTTILISIDSHYV